MLFKIPPEAEEIMNQLAGHGHEAYLVGGCVRDFSLGIEPKDYDICTSAHPEQVCALFQKTIPSGRKHGTITVLMNQLSFEVTTFRVESEYHDHRRPDAVHFSNSLREDLKRRDFTINAIAYHPKIGILDPFNGLSDLKNKIIRTVGEPDERFGEDALRLLRAVRFQARFGFSLESHTKEAIHRNSGSLRWISRERILSEMNAILCSSFAEGVPVLFETGLLQAIFPIEIPSTPDFSRFSLLPEKLSSRWAALFWHMGFADMDLIQRLCTNLRMSKVMIKEILRISDILSRPLPRNSFLLRKTLSDTGTALFSDTLEILRVSGEQAEPVRQTDRLLDSIITGNDCIRLADLAVDGNTLMNRGFPAGKQLGDLLDVLFLCVLQKPILNRKDILLEAADYISRIFIPQFHLPGTL